MTGTQFLTQHPQILRHNGQKPVIFQKIRYKPVITICITQNSVEIFSLNILRNSQARVSVSLQPSSYTYCVRRSYSTCCQSTIALNLKQPVFFALKRRFTGIFNLSRYIVVRKDQVISFPTQFCVAVLLQHFPCLNFYSFFCVIADSLTCIKKVNA